MNNLDKTYTDLLQDILDNGVTKQDRTGTGTISVFGRQIRHDMKTGFPLLTTKKMPFKTIVTELLWFLRGDTNIKYLVDNDCHIWNGDAHKRFILAMSEGKYQEPTEDARKRFIDRIKTDDKFAKKWGDLGRIYGAQWRSWEYHEGYGDTGQIDQIQNLINDLKTNPDSRRLMVNAWNVGELDQMVLPPCHYGFQVYTRELSLGERYNLIEEDKHTQFVNWQSLGTDRVKEVLDEKNIPTRAISLMWNQRSVDTFLGLPFNIASYGLLLEIIAKEVNMVPDELIGNLGDVHLYSNHVEQAKEQIGRERTHEEMVEIYNNIQDKKDREGLWTWSTRFEDNGINKRTRDPYPLPILNIFEPAIGKEISILDNLHIWSPTCFIIENYQSHPTIKAPLSN